MLYWLADNVPHMPAGSARDVHRIRASALAGLVAGCNLYQTDTAFVQQPHSVSPELNLAVSSADERTRAETAVKHLLSILACKSPPNDDKRADNTSTPHKIATQSTPFCKYDCKACRLPMMPLLDIGLSACALCFGNL